jgi:hypothetical protein
MLHYMKQLHQVINQYYISTIEKKDDICVWCVCYACNMLLYACFHAFIHTVKICNSTDTHDTYQQKLISLFLNFEQWYMIREHDTCTWLHTHDAHAYTHLYLYLYVKIYLHLYIYIYIYIYMHVYRCIPCPYPTYHLFVSVSTYHM